MTTTDMQEVDILNNFLVTVFTGKCLSHNTKLMESKGRAWENEVPVITGDQVQAHITNVNVHSSMGLDEMRPRILKELADEAAKPIVIKFEELWQVGEISGKVKT